MPQPRTRSDDRGRKPRPPSAGSTAYDIGRCIRYHCRHAWVVVEWQNTTYLLDATQKDADAMVVPLELARGAYVPESGVDQRFKRYIYEGYCRRLRSEAEARKRRRRDGRDAGRANRLANGVP